MEHIVCKKPDIARVSVIAQNLKLRALEIVAWMAGTAGVKIRPDIAEEICAAKLCVFLHALHRCDERGHGVRAQALARRRGCATGSGAGSSARSGVS